MKKLTLMLAMLFQTLAYAQNLQPILLTSQSVILPGSIAVAAWTNQNPGKIYSYPSFYYRFAAGDIVTIDFTLENKNGTQAIEVSEYKTHAVLYSNGNFKTLDSVKIKILNAGIYKFEIGTKHAFDRQGKLTIQRTPLNTETAGINSSVSWTTQVDTVFTTREETVKTNPQYEAVSLQSPMNQFVNSTSNAAFKGKSRLTFPIILPANTVEWYYTFAATRDNSQVENVKSKMKLYTQLISLLPTGGKALSIGLQALTQPPGANYCDVYLLEANGAQFFLNKQDDKWRHFPEGTRMNFMNGVVKVKSCCSNGQYFIGFNNNSTYYGVQVFIEVVAIVEKATYEKRLIKTPVSYTTVQVPVE